MKKYGWNPKKLEKKKPEDVLFVQFYLYNPTNTEASVTMLNYAKEKLRNRI